MTERSWSPRPASYRKEANPQKTLEIISTKRKTKGTQVKDGTSMLTHGRYVLKWGNSLVNPISKPSLKIFKDEMCVGPQGSYIMEGGNP